VERDAMEIVVPPAELEQLVFELLRSAGMESEGAAFTARSLVVNAGRKR
jgi:LDH2 family malate/lactate/ureidoglycolate dehydrogenase